jgi:site-specific recombinase XerD
MEKRYNLYNLEASFKKYLLAENKNSLTIKNYLSDLRHFTGWLIFKFRIQNSDFDLESRISEIFSLETITEYKAYLVENRLPAKTVNRRLSTVRKLCSFCISQGWIKENPAKHIPNFQSEAEKTGLIEEYRIFLIKKGLDSQTINSSLRDTEEFLSL